MTDPYEWLKEQRRQDRRLLMTLAVLGVLAMAGIVVVAFFRAHV
jgi:hypothetical protein